MVKQIGQQHRQVDMRAAQPIAKKADPELQTPEHRAWRQQVLRAADFRCQAVDNGKRCHIRAPERLFADHIVERKDGGAKLDPRNGQCLCSSHHVAKTAAERAKRMAQRY
jgi:hypothetical protein